MLNRLKKLLKKKHKGFEWTGTVQSVDQDPEIPMVSIPLSENQKAVNIRYEDILGNLAHQNNAPIVDSPQEDKGGFFPDMTDDEVLQYERNERLGWKNFKLPWQEQ